jgi:exodeoxyribonuclease V gamma subunit
VPIGELLDVVDRTVATSDGRPAREHVVVRHPLQPFDRRNFTRGALERGRTWSFDTIAKAGAAALEEQRPERGRFLEAPLPYEPGPTLDLEQLIAFVRHPARAFLRHRLGISLVDYTTELDDALPITLDGLQKWQIGERMLTARLAGSDAQAAYKAEIARGVLPPARFARPIVVDIVQTVEAIMDAVEETVGDTVRASKDVRVTLADGRTLSGTVPSVAGTTHLTTTFSRINPGHRLQAWVRLLALSATEPEREHRALIIGKAPRGPMVKALGIASPGPDAARYLNDLVDLYDRAMRAPVPLYTRTSAAYVEDGERAAQEEWESGFDRDREDRDPEHVRLHGGTPSFSEIFRPAPHDDEHGPPWDPTEPTRFGRYARRLWGPLLEHEE